MDTDGTSKVEVIATAIDGDHLVLETVPNKNRIQWPLKNLPRPLEIGSRLTLELTLELQKGSLQDANPASNCLNLNANPAHADKDELKRKLLEDLVN